jgi:hypothetical protein
MRSITWLTRISGAEAPAVKPTRWRPSNQLGLQLGGAVDHVAGTTQLARHFAQSVAVGTGRASDHDDHIDLRAQQFDRVLPVLRGVADVLLLGFTHVRETRLDRRGDFAASSTLRVVCVTTASKLV